MATPQKMSYVQAREKYGAVHEYANGDVARAGSNRDATRR